MLSASIGLSAATFLLSGPVEAMRGHRRAAPYDITADLPVACNDVSTAPKRRRTKVEAEALKVRVVAALERDESLTSIAARERVHITYVANIRREFGLSKRVFRTRDELIKLRDVAIELMELDPGLKQCHAARRVGLTPPYLSMLLSGVRP